MKTVYIFLLAIFCNCSNSTLTATLALLPKGYKRAPRGEIIPRGLIVPPNFTITLTLNHVLYPGHQFRTYPIYDESKYRYNSVIKEGDSQSSRNGQVAPKGYHVTTLGSVIPLNWAQTVNIPNAHLLPTDKSIDFTQLDDASVCFVPNYTSKLKLLLFGCFPWGWRKYKKKYLPPWYEIQEPFEMFYPKAKGWDLTAPLDLIKRVIPPGYQEISAIYDPVSMVVPRGMYEYHQFDGRLAPKRDMIGLRWDQEYGNYLHQGVVFVNGALVLKMPQP